MELLGHAKGTCTLTEWQYEFTVGTNPITESFVELLNEMFIPIVIDPMIQLAILKYLRTTLHLKMK